MADAPAGHYPILAACIAQNRAPRPDEVDIVALRIIREGLGARDDRPDAALQRLARRAARTALHGSTRTD